MTDIRVGLIGCGRWGRNIARVLAGQGVLAAIAVRNPEPLQGFASILGAEVISPAEMLAREGLDAVAIAVPPAEHPALVSAALAAGKHVFLEKPMALNTADAAALAKAQEAAGRVLMIGHIMLHNPAFKRLAQLVSEGAIGAARQATAQRLLTSRGDPGESALWMLAPHDVAMIVQLFGMPASVAATQFDERWCIRLDFAAGSEAMIEVGRPAVTKQSTLHVIGTKGEIVLDDTAAPDRRLRLNGEPVDIAFGEPLSVEMTHFLDAARGLCAPLSDAAEGLGVVRILEQAESRCKRSSLMTVTLP